MSSVSSAEGAKQRHACLCSLPEDVLHLILVNLDMKSLLGCRQVCKTLKLLIDERKDLQYLIELSVAGMEHNPRTQLSVTECLERLQRYQAAWHDFPCCRQNLSTTNFLSWETLWEVYGGILARDDGHGNFYFSRLPSDSRDIETKEWTVSSGLNDKILSVGMDPSQDLLVLATTPTEHNPYLSLHFRTLGAGKRHLQARMSIVRHNCLPPRTYWRPKIRIMGDYAAICIATMYDADDILDEEVPDDDDIIPNQLIVWDWKNGEQELAICGRNSITSYTFLSERHIIITSSYNFFSELPEISLKIIDFKSESNVMQHLPNVQHVLTLYYPELPFGCLVPVLAISSEPSPGWTPGEGDQVPFFVAEDNKTLFVSMNVYAGCSYDLTHAIPLVTLKQYVDHADLTKKPRMEWYEWALENTCLLDRKGLSPDILSRRSYGSRLVGREIFQSDGASSMNFEIYNFNQLEIRRRASMHEGSKISFPDVLEAGKPFVESVQTRMPYMVVTIPTRGLVISPARVTGSSDNIIILDTSKDEYVIFRV